MSDLQAAAERRRMHKEAMDATQPHLSPYWNIHASAIDLDSQIADMAFLCGAFLALTDPTPIDEAWLREIGADHRLNGEWLVADPRTLGECVEVWCIFTEDGEPPAVIVKPSNHDDCPCIIASCTRGQLNALLHALKGE